MRKIVQGCAVGLGLLLAGCGAEDDRSEMQEAIDSQQASLISLGGCYRIAWDIYMRSYRSCSSSTGVDFECRDRAGQTLQENMEFCNEYCYWGC